MASQTETWSPKMFAVLLFFLCISFSSPVEARSSEKLDQPPTDTEIMCGSCPCAYPCGQQDPPPPPTPSPPPPPKCPTNCDPLPPPAPQLSPPPPRFIYVAGVPGQVCQTNPCNWNYYYSAAQDRAAGMLILAGLGALSVAMVLG